MRGDWVADAFGTPLTQPDRRTCGPTALVVARMVIDPAYGELLTTGRHPATGHQVPGTVLERFHSEVLAMHRRVTGPVDAAGRLQVPWPRALGTPPWAVARQLSVTSGPGLPRVRYRVRWLWPRPGDAFDEIVAATTARRPVALYVGNRWLPRHVVLALGEADGALRCYDPSHGHLVDVTRDQLAGRGLRVSGWDRAWFAVLPHPIT